MSLTKLENNWYQFGNGLKWRIISPSYVCEVGREGHVPVFSEQDIITKVKRVKAFYLSHLRLGKIDQFGYGVDILVANSFTESGGSVPTPVSTEQLKNVYNVTPGIDPSAKLNAVIDFLSSSKNTKGLFRKEPGYSSPLATPGKISLGSHHSLISTALWLKGKQPPYKLEDILEMVTMLPSDSKFAAQQAEIYFEKQFSKHFLQPPLLAACYNAGSIRSASTNDWGIASTGNHIDRWVKYFNTSRTINKQQNIAEAATIIPPIIVNPSSDNTNVFSVEKVLAAMKAKNFYVDENDSKPYNLNLIGLRNPKGRLNVFDDKMMVIWKYQGVWNQKVYTITTEPGGKFINTPLKGGELCNPMGTAIVVPGQYTNSHILGKHKGYEALQQYGKLKVYRDANLNGQLDYDPATIKEAGPETGVNIHRANQSKVSIDVGPWSAGCQVFASPVEFNEFIDLCKKRSENFGKKFTYTLMLWSDL